MSTEEDAGRAPYELETELGGGRRLALHRGRFRGEAGPVLIKTAPAETSARLARELEISRRLDTPALRRGVVRARELLASSDASALVLEDPGGEPLDGVLRRGRPPLELALELVSGLATTLDAFHRAGLVHHDIRPGNLLVDPGRRRLRLMGFGLTSEVPRERRAETGRFEVDPAYMSPEQTGRTNRPVDYRTDLYSLGVVLYEVLAGARPFEAEDVLGWVHAHVARQPPPPEERAAGIPPAVSGIVMKLLAKTADDRYQSGQGLRADLERCLEALRAGETLPAFALGRGDLPVRFELPQRLYGRDTEMARVLAAVEAARAAPAVLLVTGPSGMGKSSLVDELRQRVVRGGGLFAGGKYEQLGRARPLSALLEALGELVRRYIGADAGTLTALGRRLSKRLGANLGVMVEALPELSSLVGEQRSAAAVGPAEQRRRFHRSVAGFLRAFASPEQPLVLFLDDLQWADRASLELLESCLDPQARGLLILGAYRQDEVGAGHPLTGALEDMGRSGIAVDTLRLGPLDEDAVGELVGAALRSDKQRTAPLAAVVHRHSHGHPLAVRSFLTSLHDSGLLRVERRGGAAAWHVDLEGINRLDLQSRPDHLASQAIDRLDEPLRRLLAQAAALGGRFHLEQLAVVTSLTAEAVRKDVLALCHAGLLVGWEGGYQFAHDRLRESAYALIPPAARAATHRRFGRLLAGERRLGENHGLAVFEIADHFNRARELIVEPEERLGVAQLNLAAGHRAWAAAAFSAADGYFSSGLALLGGEPRAQARGLALKLHVGAAEAALLVNDFPRALRLCAWVHQYADSLLDEIPAYETRIAVAVAELRQEEALTTLLDVLRQLGVELPLEPGVVQVEAAVLAADRVLGAEVAEDPRRVALMSDETTLVTMRLLIRLYAIASWSNQLLAWLAVCEAARLVVAHGHGVDSALVCLLLGTMRCQLLGDVEGGVQAASFGLELLQRLEAGSRKSMALSLYHVGIECYRAHLSSLLEPFAEVYRSGMEGGDLLTAMFGALNHCLTAFHSGMELGLLEALIGRYHDELVRAGADRVSVPLGQQRAAVWTLLGRSPEAGAMPLCDEGTAASVEGLRFPGGHAGHHFGITYCHDMLLHLLFRRRRRAFLVAARAAGLPEVATAGVTRADFYVCLGLLGGLSEVDAPGRRRILAVVESHQERMRRRRRNAPMNLQHRLDLVEAERQRALGRPEKAAALHLVAAQGARRQRYVQDEALAFELAGELQLALDQPDIAAVYLRAAQGAYGRWGARGKLDDLAARYPDLLRRGAGLAAAEAPPADALDRASLERAAQALSRTLLLEQLLRELMAILLENAAAQRGFLLRQAGKDLLVEASGSVDAPAVDVVHQPLEARSDLARSVVRYVARSSETVVLGEAWRDARFAGDGYIASRRLKSLLCLPILHQGRAVALVYLENDRITDAFAAERLAAVQLIASQAAVALENARLHDDLRRALEALELRNAELVAKNVELERFNFTASHDLKTPLVTIRGFLGQLEEDVAAGELEQVATDLELLKSAAGRMAQLLDDLLELSRIGWSAERRQPVALGELARRAVELLSTRIAERGVEVVIAGDLPVVHGDPSLLLRVLRNLLENALRFAGGEGSPRVEIDARLLGEEAVCAVSDNGPGIEVAYHEQIFGLFKKLDASGEGTGAGLAIVKQAVEAHGGRVWVESEGRGNGATFCFSLPRQRRASRTVL